MFEKTRISTNKCMIVACHGLGKTTRRIVKFSNRKHAELVLKNKERLKDVNAIEFCSNTEDNIWLDKNRNRDLSSPEIENNSENIDVSEKNKGEKTYLYQSLCPYYRFL